MKDHLKSLVQAALEALCAEELQGVSPPQTVHVERTRDRSHGDFATNAAMVLAKAARRRPRELAEAITARLPASDQVDRVEIAGPGFINFFMAPAAMQAVIGDILAAGSDYGRSEFGGGEPMMVEFVSANPTGPLHVGHGRGAAYGDSLANLLTAVGYRVQREYYVNDAGRQMDILTISVWLRYLALYGVDLAFPPNAYQGDYIIGAAAALRKAESEGLMHPAEQVLDGVTPAQKSAGGDKERHLDGLIANARRLLGETDYARIQAFVLNGQLDGIRADLLAFGVEFDRWYLEGDLVANGRVDTALARLTDNGYTYRENGALWLRSSEFGDEKDRVLVRANGNTTYFASDIAYHLDKIERGFNHLIDVWGADHHGYIKRMTAALQALTGNGDALEIRLVQFVSLYRGKEKLPMSTRAGQYVTLEDLRNEVGVDASRFFYVLRSNDQHLDFDLELAKSRTNDNPVYYIQYAHARVRSVFGQLKERQWHWQPEAADLSTLTQPHEQALLARLGHYDEILELAAVQRAPHTLAHYLRDLAEDFHSYYNAHTFLVDDAPLRNARLSLVRAVQQVIVNGLTLLGVSAPDQM